MTAYDIFVQAIGVIGIISSILSFQFKKYEHIMTFRTASEILFSAQYFFLKAYTGMTTNLIGCIRNLIFVKMIQKGKSTISIRVVFSALFMLFSILTWEGFKSIFIGIAKVLSTIAYGSSNTGFLRIVMLSTSICWFIYDFSVKSYAGCISGIFTISSIVISIIRIDIIKKI